MADELKTILIKDLQEADSAADTDYIAIDNGTVTKKIRVDNYNKTANGTAKSYAESAKESADKAQKNADSVSSTVTEITNNITAAQSAAIQAEKSAEAAESATLNLQTYVNAAKESADKAKASEESTKNVADKIADSNKIAQSYAVGGTDYRTGEDTDNARYYYSGAKTAEANAETYKTNASTSASAAATSEVNAKTSETNAAKSATSASSSAESATTSKDAAATSEQNASNSANYARANATRAESYAIGGTSSRSGEDTDNAKYYAQQAKKSAELAAESITGVSSFNNRTGTVTPESGDYKADQVTYDNTASGISANTVQSAIDKIAESDAKKAVKTDVDSALNLKANKTDVDSALNLKANKTDVDSALNLKANKTDVDSALNLKANKTDVASSLSGKQDNLGIKSIGSNLTLSNGVLDAKGQITVDTALSTTSANPVQNKVVAAAINSNASKIIANTSAIATKADTTVTDKLAENTAQIAAAIAALQTLTKTLSATGASRANSFIYEYDLGTSFTNDQSADIVAGTFEKVRTGGYWTINGHKYWAAHADYRLHCGDTELTKHHMLVFPDKSFYTHYMNSTNVTTGAYYGSNMVSDGLTQALATVKADFGESHVLTYRNQLANAVSGNNPSNCAWYDRQIDLMNECMVYGHQAWGAAAHNGYDVGCDKSQLALFQARPDLIVNRENWWLRDVRSSTAFCNVDADGSANDGSASRVIGVRPAFLIA